MEQYYCRQCHRQRPADHFDKPGHYTTDDLYEEEAPRPARPAAQPRSSQRASSTEEGEGSIWGLIGLGAAALAALGLGAWLSGRNQPPDQQQPPAPDQPGPQAPPNNPVWRGY